MTSKLHRRLSALASGTGPSALDGANRGLERESLRVTPKGHLAQTDHPDGLGRALTHPWITTDFGEAMLELVTPPFQTGDETLSFARDLHRFVYDEIGEELLWAASMPCFLHGPECVRIAQYGSSLSARMREVYRRGLCHRYGRAMQTIAGVHFNFSPPDAFWPVLRDIDGAAGEGRALRDETFFGLLRNYRRYGWLVLYLFGASPAVCHTYFEGRPTTLPELLPGTFHGPHATTLRMSDIGYRNHRQAGLAPSMSSLDAYVEDLERAMRTPEPDYERFGVKVDDTWQQLSANILQIENEFYGFVRPKRVVRFGERPNHALRARGVAYVEVRALDVDAFEPLGVGQEQMRFMEAFLWFCLLQDSPPLGAAGLERCDAAHRLVAGRGREPGLVIPYGADTRRLDEWAREILAEMEPICDLLDRGTDAATFRDALRCQEKKVADSDCTPSARIVAEIKARGTSFFELALELSNRHRAELLAGPPLTEERRAELLLAREESIVAQQELEAAQTGTLADYIRDYLRP
ncbi:MAG: glutamate--cysteine ligase [Deltaproteobacteria bacterium]|nr:glutamate--cysteine ligase [Deltaproteobacteria bacterium]MBW2537004.1 glutamate--cysteine ligase [Deltaproteobacteria bacterium]